MFHSPYRLINPAKMSVPRVTHPLPTSLSQGNYYSTADASYDNSLYDDDLLPHRPRHPQPQATVTSSDFLDFSDPLLTVTPEKTLHHKRGRVNDRPMDKTDSLKGSQKVRFDSTVEVKTMSPQETSTDDTSHNTSSQSSSSTTLTDSSTTDRHHLDTSSASRRSLFSNNNSNSSLGVGSIPKSMSSTSNSTFSTIESDDIDFVDVLASDFESKAKVVYSGKRKTHHKKKSVVRTSVWGEDGYGDNVLARPEFNSTILVRKELQSVKDEELDVDDVVKKKLSSSTNLRNKVAEKVGNNINS